MLKCNQCGAIMKAGSAFCTTCGTFLSEEAEDTYGDVNAPAEIKPPRSARAAKRRKKNEEFLSRIEAEAEEKRKMELDGTWRTKVDGKDLIIPGILFVVIPPALLLMVMTGIGRVIGLLIILILMFPLLIFIIRNGVIISILWALLFASIGIVFISAIAIMPWLLAGAGVILALLTFRWGKSKDEKMIGCIYLMPAVVQLVVIVITGRIELVAVLTNEQVILHYVVAAQLMLIGVAMIVLGSKIIKRERSKKNAAA
ncbi:MAG: zinc ribbon domain-containing protein [Lachnospiraceae bacterium]|nr:zinc ribbon domain-containing protein [Lachnospiraceae bacterium]